MRITVLTGGTSSERDVAIASAVQVVKALRSRGHAVAVVDTARGYIPESEEPSVLSAHGRAGASRHRGAVALERGLLLSGLAGLPVIRDAEVSSWPCMEGEERMAPFRPCSMSSASPTPEAARWAAASPWTRMLPSVCSSVAGIPTADWLHGARRRQGRREDAWAGRWW